MKFRNLSLPIALSAMLLTGVNLFTSPAWSDSGNADSGGHFMYETVNAIIDNEAQVLAMRISGISDKSWDLRMAFSGVRDLGTLTKRSLMQALLKPVEKAPLEDGDVMDANNHRQPRDFGYSPERKSIIAYKGFYSAADSLLELDNQGRIANTDKYKKLRDHLYFLLLTEAMHLHNIGVTVNTTRDASAVAQAILGFGNSDIQKQNWESMHSTVYCGAEGSFEQRQADCNIMDTYSELKDIKLVSRVAKFKKSEDAVEKSYSDDIYDSRKKLGYLVGLSSKYVKASEMQSGCSNLDNYNGAISWAVPNEEQALAIMHSLTHTDNIVFTQSNGSVAFMLGFNGNRKLTKNPLKSFFGLAIDDSYLKYRVICVGNLNQ